MSIIISMFLNQVVITFTDSEKYELQSIINSFKVQNKESKQQYQKHSFSRQDRQFKESIVNFIKSKKYDLQEKNQYIKRIKEFLIQQGCIDTGQLPLSQSQLFAHNELYNGLQKLHAKIIENKKNQETFQLFIAFIKEMKDLREEKIYQFEYQLSKANQLNRIQREILAFIAKKLVKVQKWTKMNDIEDEVTSFFTKIIHYGIHQQVNKQIQKISSLQIRNKSYRLIQYLQKNCIQIKQEFSPVVSVLNKLSTTIYDKHQIQRSLTQLPENIKLIFQPICFQIFRLREQGKISRIGDETASKNDLRKNQMNQLQLRQQCELWKHKSLCYQSELKKIKFILQKISYLNNLFREQSLYQEIQKQLISSSEQVKIYLQRIYNHLKEYQQLSKGKKMSFVERKDKQIEFLQQKLRNALQELDVYKQAKDMSLYQQSLLLDQNSFLKQESCQNFRVMDQYHQEMNNLNNEIGHHHNQISELSKQIVQYNRKLQDKIDQSNQLNKKIENLIGQKDSISKQLEVLRIGLNNSQLQIESLKSQNQHVNNKNKQNAAQMSQLRQKVKAIDQLKHFETENLQLLAKVQKFKSQIEQAKHCNLNHAQNQQEQAYKIKIQKAKQSQQVQKQQQLTNKLKQQQQLSNQQRLRIQNESLKQQRIYRINQQKQMKRLYRDQREEINQINSRLNEYKQKYQHLLKQYNLLKNQKESTTQRIQRMKVSHAANLNMTNSQMRQKQATKKMHQQYKILHNNFEELKSYNDLLKSENNKLKEKYNQLKQKTCQGLNEYRQMKMNSQKQLFMLQTKNKQLQTKISILQQQNLNIKVKMHINTNQAKTLNCSNHKYSISQQERLKVEIKQIKIKNQEERIKIIKELKYKQEQISMQRIQMLKLQQRLDQITIPNKAI